MCEVEKPDDEFYARDRTCKVCRRALVAKNRAEKSDYYREYDARRYKDDPRVKARHARYLATPEGKSAQARAGRKFIANNPEKRAAHVALNNAVRDGRIAKPLTCTKCGRDGVRIHGHHFDYSRPLDVDWMCSKCHYDLHHP